MRAPNDHATHAGIVSSVFAAGIDGADADVLRADIWAMIQGRRRLILRREADAATMAAVLAEATPATPVSK